MDQGLAKKIIQDTARGYDLISEKFAQTRNHLWKDLEFIGQYCQKGDKVLDFGCGNGRLAEFLAKKEVEYSGLDISDKLLKEAQNRFLNQKRVSFQKISDFDSLPLESESFNVVYAIAVFHHLPSFELRQKMAREFYRILKPEGLVVVSVWNLYQRKYIKNIIRNWIGKIRRTSDLDWKDCFISFTDNRKDKFERYHHAFTKRELARLFSQAGFSIGKCDTINGKNIVLVGSK